MILIPLNRHQNVRALGVGNMSHTILLRVPHIVCLQLVTLVTERSYGFLGYTATQFSVTATDNVL